MKKLILSILAASIMACGSNPTPAPKLDLSFSYFADHESALVSLNFTMAGKAKVTVSTAGKDVYAETAISATLGSVLFVVAGLESDTRYDFVAAALDEKGEPSGSKATGYIITEKAPPSPAVPVGPQVKDVNLTFDYDSVCFKVLTDVPATTHVYFKQEARWASFGTAGYSDGIDSAEMCAYSYFGYSAKVEYNIVVESVANGLQTMKPGSFTTPASTVGPAPIISLTFLGWTQKNTPQYEWSSNLELVSGEFYCYAEDVLYSAQYVNITISGNGGKVVGQNMSPNLLYRCNMYGKTATEAQSYASTQFIRIGTADQPSLMLTLTGLQGTKAEFSLKVDRTITSTSVSCVGNKGLYDPWVFDASFEGTSHTMVIGDLSYGAEYRCTAYAGHSGATSNVVVFRTAPAP